MKNFFRALGLELRFVWRLAWNRRHVCVREPIFARIALCDGLEAIMGVLLLINLLVFMMTDQSNRWFVGLNGFLTLTVVIYGLARTAGVGWEFRAWKRWARRSIVLEDKRHNLTQTDFINTVHVWARLRQDVAAWCWANCKGRVGVVPQRDPSSRRHIVFTNPDDAFHFKMRWL